MVGDSTIPERFGIIKATKIKALQQMEDLKKQLELLDYKENYYENLIKNNEKDKYNPVNDLQTAVSKKKDLHCRSFMRLIPYYRHLLYIL